MTVRIIQADCREALKMLPDESVHCVLTSPPYWQQRDYLMAEQIGWETTPEEYIEKLTLVFREIRRVLRSDGTAWINLGDKWAGSSFGGGGSFMKERAKAWAHFKNKNRWRPPPPGYKNKDLIGLPWMFAFAARVDGWYLRQCNIWAKPNSMPESTSDRSTASHEYVFQLTKSRHYWYNDEAARTPFVRISETRLAQHTDAPAGNARADTDQQNATPVANQRHNGANLRSVWWISRAQYRGEHFAVMPDMLAEICIVAGCPVDGIVLDPFAGIGTTGLVADRLGRNAILIELNADYCRIAERRIREDKPLLAEVQTATYSSLHER